MNIHQSFRLFGLTLALTLPLSSAVLAQTQTQRAVLSGTTQGVRWSLYGPGEIANLMQDATNLRVSAHPEARVLGADYQADNQRAVLAFQVNAPLATVFDFHDQQLRDQGFQRTGVNVEGNDAFASYTRDGAQLLLFLSQTDPANHVYRAKFDLTNLGLRTASASGMQGGSSMADMTPVVQAQDQAGVSYALYPASLPKDRQADTSGKVSFSVPQGATVTNTDVNINGDLSAQVTSALGLQQMMNFYDQQFKRQGFKLVNPTDTGAGGDNALTYIYERNNTSRVSFSVEKEDNYRLVWDFQTLQSNTVAPVTSGPRPIYGYEYGGLRYDFYGPHDLTTLPATPRTVRFGVPAGTTATRVNRQGEDATVTLRSSLTPQQLMAFYDRQFQRQGYHRQGTPTSTDSRVQVVYQRDSAPNNRLIWTAERQSADAYRVSFNIQNTQS